jgi:hypothetical protein
MAKKRMYFNCSCGKKNWLNLDPDNFKKQEIILYCCECGKYFGQADKEVAGDGGAACCECIPYEGFAKGQTNGPLNPTEKLSEDTLWSEASGTKGNKEGITRAEFLKKYGRDPWIQWCGIKGNENKAICEGYDNRCQNHEPVIAKPLIVVHREKR